MYKPANAAFLTIFIYRVKKPSFSARGGQMTTNPEITELIAKLRDERNLPDEGLAILIDSEEATENLGVEADKIRRKIYGDAVYIRPSGTYAHIGSRLCFIPATA